MSTTVVIVGLGLAAIGYAGRFALRVAPKVAENLEKKVAELPKMQKPSFTFSSFTDVKYHKGGFESKMSKREAALILGVSPNANKIKIKEAHKRVMLINHPDKGGSPFLSSKINEAKDIMDKTAPK